MGRPVKDLSGQRFGKLIVLEYAGFHITPSGTKRQKWLCKCDCGNTIVTTAKALQEGHTKSCKCTQYDRGFNEMREDGNSIFIKVKDKEVIIDKEDLMKFYPSKVNISAFGYAVTKRNKKLHRIIIACPMGYEIDHINHNKLDNRKSNLRIVTRSENQMNKIITSNTGEFGIHLDKKGWYNVVIDGARVGMRRSLTEAISIRDAALIGTKQAELNYYLQGVADD